MQHVGAILWFAEGHGALVTPRPRNSIDFEYGPRVANNITWAWCQNGGGQPCPKTQPPTHLTRPQ